MLDEVMQLVALAKNDEAYFKRIEDLKQKQLELAHVMEIARTLGEADMHLASARQEKDKVLKQAAIDAAQIKASAESFVSDAKSNLEKAKAKLETNKEKEANLILKEKELEEVKRRLEESIQEHRKLTQLRTEEFEQAQKVRASFESKMKQLRDIAAQP